ncbi:MAG: serine hydrolase domain-containing protein [Candidatus Eisenbacteria bacterium]
MSRTTSVFLLALTLLVSGLARAGEQFVFPETRAGEIAMDYFEAYNSGDVERLRRHYAFYRSDASLAETSPDERAERTMGLYEQTGPLTPVAVIHETESSITITAHAEKIGMWVGCAFQLEKEEPHKLALLMIQPASPPEMATGGVKEWTDLADLLTQVRTETGIPAIAAAIIEDGLVTDAAVVGVRQVGTTDSAGIDDGFHIGSVGKSVTATMIGRLVEEGLLDWNMTIAQALGDMDIRVEYRDVTLMQLLQHRSGLPGYLTFEDSTDARLVSLPGTPTEQRRAFVADVLQSEPIAQAGSAVNYSNAGYVVAALMAEDASASSWEELVSHHVFEPTGMKNTGFGWPATEARPDQPRGHYYEESAFRAQGIGEYRLGDFLAPAGDIHASIGDLALYAKMHLDGLAGHDGPLRAATIRQLHADPETPDDRLRYACGWMIVEKEGLRTVHTHSGSAGTFYATVELYPDENRAIVVLANAGAGAGAAESIIKAINERAKPRTR